MADARRGVRLNVAAVRNLSIDGHLVLKGTGGLVKNCRFNEDKTRGPLGDVLEVLWDVAIPACKTDPQVPVFDLLSLVAIEDIVYDYTNFG
jgi:hypothetical protein